MEKVMQKLQQLEEEVLDLKEEVSTNRSKIVKLERKLVESQRKIEALEKFKKEAELTDGHADGHKKLDSGVIDGIGEEKRDQGEGACSPQDTDALTELENILERHRDLGGGDSTLTSFGESKLQNLFKEHRKLVQEKRVPLSTDDYYELATLETVAGIKDGPATNVVEEHIRYNKYRMSAYFKVSAELRDKFPHPNEAAEEYIRLTCRDSSFSKDSKFYYVHINEHGNRFLTMNKSSPDIHILNAYTKEVCGSWSGAKIRECSISKQYNVVLRLEDQGMFVITMIHGGNQELQASIFKLIPD